jgi:hypothetical protein
MQYSIQLRIPSFQNDPDQRLSQNTSIERPHNIIVYKPIYQRIINNK